ncbi:MAG: 50S ribosomal protein L4 [Actinobacteria bacterium RBG_16_70_17]|nr:MAG: 50S ribosomal protein L4 [Actinobacteria bacterium RBG_16_70_17]
MTAALYNSAGERVGEVALDPAVFGIEPNVAVMHQVVTAQLAAARSGTADTKTRGEVSGGGKKPWRQKGLGRARQGSIRSPQFRGGGTVFGPHPRSYRQRTPKKMRRLALHSALSARAAEGQVKVVESFDWAEPKTKQAVGLLKAMEVSGKALVVLGKGDEVAVRSLGNLPQVVLTGPGRLATYDVLWADTLIFTRETVGMAGGTARFEVAGDDFVREEGDQS